MPAVARWRYQQSDDKEKPRQPSNKHTGVLKSEDSIKRTKYR